MTANLRGGAGAALGLAFALAFPAAAGAQVVRLAAAGVLSAPAVVAPPAGAPALTSVLAAPSAVLAPVLAAPAALAAPTAALAAASAVAAAPELAARPALDAAAARAPDFALPDRSVDAAKAEAGHAFDLSAAVSGAAAADLGARAEPSLPAADRARPVAAPAAPPARTPAPRLLPQFAERLKTLALRALSLPAHVWPFAKLARFIAHGEPLVGLTPAGAARAVERLGAEGGVVIGRLAWELRDAWSIRGAERSYLRLIDRLAEAKARRPGLDVAVSVDAESLGLQLRGASAEERESAAGDAVLRIARAARARGLPLEIDMGTSDAMPAIVRIAARVVREERMPVRLALAARYLSSEPALAGWAAHARATGLRLGVRLVKGSFIEARQPDAVNRRRELLDRYKAMITLALENGDALDVAVASHNPDIWEHARAESRRLDADFTMHVIRGVNMPLQAEMRAAGKIERQYVSYGLDAPTMGLTELYTNWKQTRALAGSPGGPVD